MNRSVLLLAALWCGYTAAAEIVPALPDEELTEVVITAPEPRYVAPTTRDRIGRVWVPVLIDGKGPFRLVFDTGALRTAITTQTATRLVGNASLENAPRVRLHGATGSAIAPTVKIDKLRVGDLEFAPQRVPVVADVFGGAEGLLGTDGMQDHRIFIDFRNDFINIARSRNRRAAAGFTSVRFLPDKRNLLVVPVIVGSLPVRAIIDTGAQSTVGNSALQAALRWRDRRDESTMDQVHGATGDVQSGPAARVSPIRLGDLQVRNAHVTFADLHIFDTWEMRDVPTLMIGMDIIGLLDQLVIDYHRRELHIKPRQDQDRS
jgi:predicted aspartyl protease